MVNKDLNTLLLYLNDSQDFCKVCGERSGEQGKTHEEIIAELNWTKKRASKAIREAENSGMLRGDWEPHPEKEWVRRFYIGGEETRYFIETLKKYRGSPVLFNL